jgi:ligand-binding sensor domain-containing protein/signal transduction histidine kinase
VAFWRLLTAVLLFCSVGLGDEYSRRIWRTEDGLPQNKIQVIEQTPDGYLWIGTSGGLVRFDGVRFVVFDRSNTSPLRDDSILALCPTRDGSLWIGTEGGGLVHMNHGVFQAFGAREGLTNGFVRAISEDRSGTIWVGTDRGFFRYERGRLVRLDARGDVPILAARVIYEDRTGNVWVGTSYGIYRMVDGVMSRSRPDYQEVGDVTSIVEATDGALWFAAESGLHRTLHGELVPDAGHDDVSARTICQDHDGNIWVGTIGEGLMRIGNRSETVYRASDILPDNTVWSVFEDREKNLWIGTQDGLLRLTRSAVHTITSKDGLADDNVATVYDDPRGALWIGTITNQLYRLEGQRALIYHLPPRFQRLRPNSIYMDREGVMWIGTTAQGAIRIAGNDVRVFTMRDGMRSNSIRQFLEDRKGIIWIATGSGLSRWDGHSIRTYYLEDGLAYGGVRVLAEDTNGDLLVGTDGGLNRVRDGKFVRDPVFVQLGNERIWTILPGRNGSLWLGTRGNGMVRIRDGRITRYTTHDGLLSNSIYQILDDGHDRFWISCSAGIFSADRRELDAVAEGRAGPIAVVPYGTGNGMRSSQMNGGVQSAGCRARSGAFWFPSVKGAVRIDPGQLRVLPPSPVLIESIIADDRPVPLSHNVMIPPGRGKLEIEYTSPNLLSPERVTFKYRLEGFDDSWTPSPQRRAAYYTNLPPGKYRFRVAARDGAFPDRVSEAVLSLTWRPHFYQTAWFYLGLGLLAGLGVWGIFRLYARQTKARYGLVLAERTRLAREMHDTVIQGCVGVSTLLEAARSMPPAAGSKTRELLERAANQIRLTVNEAREAVWDLRHSNMEQGLAGTLQTFARQITAAEGIPVRADISGPPAPLEERAGRNLLLVAREAIRNAALHGHPAHIEVMLRYEPAGVELEVSDDGQGFNPETARENGHYGIVGMRERVEQSGGTFRLHSSPGKGTHVTARFPSKGTAARNGTGTDCE